ncbi:Double-strand break repair mus-23 [Lecanosticta acicola]|uniref:Double-strand break repair protein n=1 Tax=Lecanosticta acicola TaxID=111012 RepID=A0AAI8Z2V3_9PEZI|nr:Double-strand break repair mus-23 [Lecanosticta acicola]
MPRAPEHRMEAQHKPTPTLINDTAADTIRILISTDNHVGYNERDPVRGDDSWKSFDEVMSLAKERDVDMILLAGDLFHENKPSRKSMYQVMRSLRANCYGDKPCELEMLSDGSEHFAGAFNHVNYDDEDINVAIPVFSIHGNHDDPSGEGHLAALDILAMSGLLNYYGRTPEADNIEIKPVLLKKGKTKLALYGMSNVRDERLFRTFRDGKVKFFQPSPDSGDWFNIMSVHQNHHAYTPSSYLPEQFLPNFMDLIVWGHEHECKIDPQINPEMGFKVMQPGSSVATSLCPGEAVPKHVAILSVTENNYNVEPVRLKTVRPFVYKEIALKDYDEMQEIAFMNDNKTRVHQFLTSQVDELIDQAQQEWYDVQQENGGVMDEDEEPPKPIIRLRVECTAPNGGKFDTENPQRFSGRFADRVANPVDVVQFHRKRNATRATKNQPDLPDEEVIAQITIDSVKVDELVKEFLTAQSLTILPQNRFSDAVNQYVEKDDRHAMEEFLSDSLKLQRDSLLHTGDGDRDQEDDDLPDDDVMAETIENNRIRQEDAHARGELKLRRKKGNIRPKPNGWDSDENGPWEESAMSIMVEDDGEGQDGEDDDGASFASGARPARGRGSRGGRGGRTAAGTTRKTAATTKKAPAKNTAGRGKQKQPSDDEDEDDDIIMLDDDDDDEDESQSLFVSQSVAASSRSRTQQLDSPTKKPAPKTTRGRGGSAAAAANGRGKQTQLSFGGSQATGTARTNGTGRAAAPKTAPSRRLQPSDDEISDDDAFEPPPAAQRSARTGRR